MGISKPPLSRAQLDHMLRKQQIEKDARELKLQAEMARIEQMTEIKRLEIQRMMNSQSFPTSSIYDPRTYNSLNDTTTPFGNKPDSFISNVSEIKNTLPEPEQHTPHVVPTTGKKHHIEVEEISHKIVPRRKSIIESVFGFIKTRTSGPK